MLIKPSKEVLSVLGVDYYPRGRVISIKSQLCIPSGGLCSSGGDPICSCKLQSFAYLALCWPLITTSGLGELRGPLRFQFLKPGRRIREKLQTTGKKFRPLGMNFFFFWGGDPVYCPLLTPTCEDPVRKKLFLKSIFYMTALQTSWSPTYGKRGKIFHFRKGSV